MQSSPNDIYDRIGQMVDEAMVHLKNLMEQYESPILKTAKGTPRTGIAALAEDLKVNRSNLTRIFSDTNDQQMSTWLFIRICQALDIWPNGWEYRPSKFMETQNVKIAMITPRDPLMVCVAQLLAQ